MPRLGRALYAEMVARHAAANGVPTSLVHRVIMRESRYNPRVVSKGNYGMMQIRLGTARAMGYTGTASGLLDPEVNMTYAVKYLAGAYRVAGGSEGGAVANYARGYYHQAKRRNLSPYEAPGSAAFAMQTSPQGVRAGRRDFETTATVTWCFKLGKSRRRLRSPPASPRPLRRRAGSHVIFVQSRHNARAQDHFFRRILSNGFPCASSSISLSR